MSETLVNISDIIQRVLSSQNQRHVSDIQLQLVSRALQHLDSNGVPFPIAVTAAPTPLNLQEYTRLTNLQPFLNLVLDNLSKDVETMTHYLNPVAEYDPFVKGFLDIYKGLPGEHHQRVALGLSRHDFMFDISVSSEEVPQLKLVEFNLVAASLGALGEGVFDYHQTVLRKNCVDTGEHNHRVDIVKGYSRGLSLAYQLYNKQYNCERKPIVVMVNQSHGSDSQFNYFDQQLILNELERNGVPTYRYTAQYLADNGTRGPDGRYTVDGREVAVVYFRTLYDPSHFVSADIWRFRRDVEHSAAVTVPCVRHQLVNAKLFQMVLCQRAVLDRYTPNSTITDQILEFFCETLHLNLDEEGDRNAQLGINQPENYVLKPQREGGGNNIWEDEMRKKLISLSGNPARAQYILMRRIRAPTGKNKIIRRGIMSDTVDTVSEFGCFSVYLTDEAGNVLQNEVVGPLVRTKIAGENEGGVAVGIAAIDSPYFV